MLQMLHRRMDSTYTKPGRGWKYQIEITETLRGYLKEVGGNLYREQSDKEVGDFVSFTQLCTFSSD